MNWLLFSSLPVAVLFQCYIALGFTTRAIRLIGPKFPCERSRPDATSSAALTKHNDRRVQHLRALFDNSFDTPPIPVWVVVPVAFTLGFAANSFIQRLLSGNRGLGNFLSDGSGFGNSKFQPLTTSDQDRAVSGDPLPWLRLPELDFVEVAGQTKADLDSDTPKGDSNSFSEDSFDGGGAADDGGDSD